jgi:hypothetical protein
VEQSDDDAPDHIFLFISVDAFAHMIFQIINRAPSGAARQISSLLRQPVEMIHRPKECCLEQPAC